MLLLWQATWGSWMWESVVYLLPLLCLQKLWAKAWCVGQW